MKKSKHSRQTKTECFTYTDKRLISLIYKELLIIKGPPAQKKKLKDQKCDRKMEKNEWTTHK